MKPAHHDALDKLLASERFQALWRDGRGKYWAVEFITGPIEDEEEIDSFTADTWQEAVVGAIERIEAEDSAT
jgi:hypothetical protein